MKTRNTLLFGWMLLLLLRSPSHAQTSKLAVGIDFGTCLIQRGSLEFLENGGTTLISSGLLIPKNIRGNLEFNLSSNIRLRFSGGYGYTKEKLSTNAQLFGDYGSAIIYPSQINRDVKFSAAGFPLECSAIFRLPFDDAGKFAVYFGVGGGYYFYKYNGTGFQEQNTRPDSLEHSNSPVYVRGDLQSSELKIAGFAQFFLLGLDFRLTSRIKVNIEIGKIGLSGLSMKKSYEYAPLRSGYDYYYRGSSMLYQPPTIKETRELDYNAGGGLSEVALLVGVSLDLFN